MALSLSAGTAWADPQDAINHGTDLIRANARAIDAEIVVHNQVVGVITEINGTVTVRLSDGTLVQAVPGMPIMAGDQILRTGADGAIMGDELDEYRTAEDIGMPTVVDGDDGWLTIAPPSAPDPAQQRNLVRAFLEFLGGLVDDGGRQYYGVLDGPGIRG